LRWAPDKPIGNPKTKIPACLFNIDAKRHDQIQRCYWRTNIRVSRRINDPVIYIRNQVAKVGDMVVENVIGSVGPMQGSLLGQSFLERFRSWSIDNTNHVLLLEPR